MRKTGSRLFEKLPVNEVARVRLYDGTGEVNLELKDGRWVVRERGNYSASVQEIGDLLVKLPDLKVVQTEDVGATLLPRLNLVAPAKDVKPETAGTQLELSDKSGKVIGGMLLGKKVIKIEPSPLPIKQETPVGPLRALPRQSDGARAVGRIEERGRKAGPVARQGFLQGRPHQVADGERRGRSVEESPAARNTDSGNSRKARDSSIRARRSARSMHWRGLLSAMSLST